MAKVQLATGEIDTDLVTPGDVFQISPDFSINQAFACCMMSVTEVYDWGVQGYVFALGPNRGTRGGCAFIRVKWDQIAYVGKDVWAAA